MNLFDYINSINNKQYSPPSENDKGYSIYMVDRFFMHFADTIYIVNEINGKSLTNKMHYDFLYNVVSKRKRFTSWYKEVEDKDLTLISSYYECNEDKAKQYLRILDKNDLERMSKEMRKGGINE